MSQAAYGLLLIKNPKRFLDWTVILNGGDGQRKREGEMKTKYQGKREEPFSHIFLP